MRAKCVEYSLKRIAKLKGIVGEFVAEEFLEAEGFEVHAHYGNECYYDNNAWGSFDLQAEKEGKRYDIEVKYGQSSRLDSCQKNYIESIRKGGAVPVLLRVSGGLNPNKWTIKMRELKE